MKRLGFIFTAILTLIGVMAAAPVAAQGTTAGVTGASEAVFPDGATFNGVPLGGLTLGQGVIIASDGTAVGQFQAVLWGTSLLGQAQDVTVEGKVSSGSVAMDGSATFSGTATVDMGDGTLPVPGVQFTATASMEGLALTLDATRLPVASLVGGSITIK